jgi:Flp pilus assembly protein TadG
VIRLAGVVLARLGKSRADDGSAIIEFIFVGILVLVPLLYLIVAVAVVQSNTLAVTNAAREAGRAFATSESTSQALERATIAARLAEHDQGIDGTPVLSYVAAGASCGSPAIEPELAAGSVFTICVTNSVQIPGVPSLLAGRGIRTIGKYQVHVDDFRTHQ